VTPPVTAPLGAQAPSGVEVSGLGVRFGTKDVLKDLSFRVAKGEALAVIGPNGCGKTVLFKALIGALPYRGRVEWAEGTRVGYVPQKLDIERDLPVSGRDFLRAKAEVSRTPPIEVERQLSRVGLDPAAASQALGTLSGGQFQRLLVAFALLGRPTALLLDEPTAGVDEPGQEGLYEMIRRVQQEEGLTLLFISHEVSVVYRFADNVLCLSRGPRCYGPPVEVLTPERLGEIYGAPVRFHLHGGPPG